MKIIIPILIVFLIQSYAYSNTIEPKLKVNVIRGESMVTINVDKSLIRNVFLPKILDLANKTKSQDQLFVDVFVYQFPADYPTVAVTIRTKNGTHFFERETVKLFGDRALANIKISKKLLTRIPDTLDTGVNYKLELEDIFLNRKSINLIKIATDATMDSYRRNYNNMIYWNENESLPFIIEEFNTYLSYCMNYQGLRKKIKKAGEVNLRLSIHNGQMEIVDIQAPFQLTPKETNRLNQAIEALPLWVTDENIENLDMSINFK